MRRFVLCLTLLLPLAAAHASDALVAKERGACVYADSAEADGSTPRPATPRAPASKPAPAPSGGGGGGDSDLMPRLRTPKWHSFLPGMFR